jgi:hypothetical protein
MFSRTKYIFELLNYLLINKLNNGGLKFFSSSSINAKNVSVERYDRSPNPDLFTLCASFP